MEGSIECFDTLICSGARRLTGYQRRLFTAEVTTELCEGSARQAERRFGWGRETVLKGLHESRQGIRCLENFAARGRLRSEEKDPQLAADIRAIVEPHTYADPQLKSSRRYTNLSAAEVREALIATGHPSEKLPSERTLRDILNRMNYRLKRIQKGKPLKKTKETDAIFANVKEVQQQARSDPETLEISMDTKAKVALGDYARGGKNQDRRQRSSDQGMGSRSARQGETGPLRYPDGGGGSVDPVVRVAGDQRRLGRCLADVVAACSGILRTHQTPGDLSGQRSKELGSADPVSQADGSNSRPVKCDSSWSSHFDSGSLTGPLPRGRRWSRRGLAEPEIARSRHSSGAFGSSSRTANATLVEPQAKSDAWFPGSNAGLRRILKDRPLWCDSTYQSHQ